MWDYAEAGRLFTMRCVTSDKCIFCRSEMLRLPSQKFETADKALLVQVSLCPCCGWWSAYRVHQGEIARTAGVAEGHSGTIGCLKELDLTDVSLPLKEVRQYLAARPGSIHDLHPRQFEEVVCSIFGDLGWQARVTAYSGDDGIDVILDGQEGHTVGVQVKRYREENRIEAEQIRSLAGALLFGDHTAGVFITTSGFRRGARRTADGFAQIGLPIKLVDARRFLEALGVAQVASFGIDQERLNRYVLSTAHHLGTGLHREFVPGENLTDRPVIVRAYGIDEPIDSEGCGETDGGM